MVRGAERLGHTGYQYAHDFEGHFVDQEYMPGTAVFYEPGDQGYEETIRRRMAQWQRAREEARRAAAPPAPAGGPARAPDAEARKAAS